LFPQVYSLSEREKNLGLGASGVTTYFSDNCDEEDAERVNRFFKAKSMEGYINRVLKTKEGKVEIRNAGVKQQVSMKSFFPPCLTSFSSVRPFSRRNSRARHSWLLPATTPNFWPSSIGS